jgi:hypothetical protein
MRCTCIQDKPDLTLLSTGISQELFFLFEQEGKCHEGAKPQRVVFCSNLGFLFTTGFTRMSKRMWAVWDQVCLLRLIYMIVNTKFMYMSKIILCLAEYDGKDEY